MRDRIEKVRLVNRVSAVLHRFWTFYERPGRDVEQQLELVTDDLHMRSGVGETRGHGEYRSRLTQLPVGVRNAHRLQALAVERGADGVIVARAQVAYQNVSPQSVLDSYTLRYDARFVESGGVLPKLQQLLIAAEGALDLPTFADAYPENRVRATVLMWLASLESPQYGSEGLKELFLMDGFELHFASQPEPVTQLEKLAAWFEGTGSRIDVSSHGVEKLRLVEGSPGQYRVRMEFPWEGITKDGTKMQARTQHDWELVDTGDKYARIRTMRVVALVPFHPVAE